MAKVHRMYRKSHRAWWEVLFEQRGWMQDVKNGTFGKPHNGLKACIEVSPERYVLPFVCSDDGVPLHVPCDNLPLHTPARSNSNRHSERRAGEFGIPAGVDVQEWYAAYLKREELHQEKHEKVSTTEGKYDYYRDVAIALYRSSNYSIDESVRMAFSPQGDSLRVYLSDDKRNPLNRTYEDEEAC